MSNAARFPDDRSLPLDSLSIAALAYLALPNVIFFLGWMRIPFAFILVLLLAWTLRQSIHWGKIHWLPTIPLTSIGIFALAACTWSAFGGAGHIGYANPDWLVRDAVYGDLIYSSWPPSYREEGEIHSILRSAIGFFLPGAVTAKLFGIQFADKALYVWETLGVFFFLCLLRLPSQRKFALLVSILIVVFFSGMDIVGATFAMGDWPIFPLRLEWWSPFSYSSLSGQLFWAPNHILPIWLGTALLHRHWYNPEFPNLLFILLPLLLIWTPFAPIALAPFAILLGLCHIRSGAIRLAAPTLVFAIVVTIVVSRFLTMNISDIPLKTGATEVAEKYGSFIYDYARFSLLEFGALALALSARIPQPRPIFILSVGILALLPFISFGPSNDLLLRASIPPLIFLMLFCIECFKDWMDGTASFPWLIAVMLTIGAATPFGEMWRAASWHAWQPNYRQTLIDTQEGRFPPHYVGKLDSKDMTLLLRAPGKVPKSGERLRTKPE